jgi:hypothetical protein
MEELSVEEEKEKEGLLQGQDSSYGMIKSEEPGRILYRIYLLLRMPFDL